jgi:translation initiation factor 2-alpha kinase 4
MKPENVFLTKDANGRMQVKIGDFGLATSGLFAPDRLAAAAASVAKGLSDRLTSAIGTRLYCAPEVLEEGFGAYNSKVDVSLSVQAPSPACTAPHPQLTPSPDVLPRHHPL